MKTIIIIALISSMLVGGSGFAYIYYNSNSIPQGLQLKITNVEIGDISSLKCSVQPNSNYQPKSLLCGENSKMVTVNISLELTSEKSFEYEYYQPNIDSLLCGDNSKKVNVNISLELYSEKTFDLEYGCDHPFVISDANNNIEASFSTIQCLLVTTHKIPAGVSTYSLKGYIIFNTLPINLLLIANLGTNLVTSPSYSVTISI